MEEKIKQIYQAQINWVAAWHANEPEVIPDGFLGLVENQHLQNFRLWHKEDLARIPDAEDKIIADVKRDIDRLNQQRNDLIEKLDEYILDWLERKKIVMNLEAEQNSETPGNIIDRCSIMALKLYHMQEEVGRPNASDEHRQKAAQKVRVLQEQRKDMLNCLVTLLAGIRRGTKMFKTYKQFKMYNDPSLNPQIYKNRSA